MKTITLLTVALLAVARSMSAAAPLTVAVFDFDSKDESVKGYGPKVAALVTAKLSENAEIHTVERAELEKALGEQELGLSGTVSPETAAKVGNLTGAKVLVTGRVFKAGKELLAVAKIMSTETSRVFAQSANVNSGGSVSDLADALAAKISKTLSEQHEVFLASAPNAEDKVARFLKDFKPTQPLAVSVKIPETHYGQPARDPAAETELETILQRAGFKIVDDQSETKPDVLVTGEAFSAYGLRRGNLISCKSRIELKARDRKSGEILLADRQTGVAVDITEQTAAKSALENAARELALRLLPKLSGH